VHRPQQHGVGFVEEDNDHTGGGQGGVIVALIGAQGIPVVADTAIVGQLFAELLVEGDLLVDGIAPLLGGARKVHCHALFAESHPLFVEVQLDDLLVGRLSGWPGDLVLAVAVRLEPLASMATQSGRPDGRSHLLLGSAVLLHLAVEDEAQGDQNEDDQLAVEGTEPRQHVGLQ